MTVMALALNRRDAILEPLSPERRDGPRARPHAVAGQRRDAAFSISPSTRPCLRAADVRRRRDHDGAAAIRWCRRFIQDGALRDPAASCKRLGCVWSPSQLAAPLPRVARRRSFPSSTFIRSAISPACRVCAYRDPTQRLLPLGEVLTNGKDGDRARFLEIELGDDRQTHQAASAPWCRAARLRDRSHRMPKASSLPVCSRLAKATARSNSAATPTCCILAV